MPNRTTANLVKAQAILLDKFQKQELRFREPVTFMEFVRNAPIMMPNYLELRKREDRVVETNFNDREARGLGTGGRTFNHTGTKGDSSLLTPSWTPYDDVFNTSLKQADTSVYTLEQQIAVEFGNVIGNFAEGLETVFTDFAFNNRSQVNIDASGEGTFSAQFAYEITESSNGNRAIQIAKSVMHNNKYNGNYIAFCDTVAFNKFQFDAAQGAANQENLSFQFGNVKYIHSVNMAALAAALGTPYVKGFWIVVEEGSIAALPWIPKQNRQGVDTKEQRFATLLNPVDGLTYALHTYDERADDSANNGSEQDEVTQYEVSIDLAPTLAPLTVVNETVLQAFALV